MTMRHTGKQSGITLIELVIVIVMIGILAAIAIPSYQDSVRKTRRTDAKVALNDMAQRLERCRTQFGAYDDGACPSDDVTSPEGYYSIGIVSTATTFALTATAQGVQTKDVKCRTLTLSHLGVKGAGDADGNAAPACW